MSENARRLPSTAPLCRSRCGELVWLARRSRVRAIEVYYLSSASEGGKSSHPCCSARCRGFNGLKLRYGNVVPETRVPASRNDQQTVLGLTGG